VRVPRDRDVLIIGARGVLGALTAREFRAAGWRVRCGVRTPGPGQVGVDLDSVESVAAAIGEHDLVINTVPNSRLLAERHVLERGGALINISALPAAAGRSLRAIAGGARGTVLMNAGIAPGVTNLVAADLLRRHAGADELEIVLTLSAVTPRGPAGADFVHRGLSTLRQHRTVVVPLPQPFGERRCPGFAEGEAGWLGGIAEGRVVRSYVCIAEPETHERILALNDARAMDKLPRSLFKPRRLTNANAAGGAPVAHWAAAKAGGRRLAARTIECRGDVVHAARTTVVFAEALSEHRRGGCFDPEEIWALPELEPRLRAAGVHVDQQPVHP